MSIRKIYYAANSHIDWEARINQWFCIRCDLCDKEWLEPPHKDIDDPHHWMLPFASFMEAVDGKKAWGFKSIKKDGKWYDVCPKCWERKANEWRGHKTVC